MPCRDAARSVITGPRRSTCGGGGYSCVVSDREQLSGGATADAAGLLVPRAPKSIALVRRYAVDACIRFGWHDSADTVALLSSEVATNAVLHAHGDNVRVRVIDLGMRLRVMVIDGSQELPIPRQAPAGAEGGRGLALVEALAAEWGVDVLPDGKRLWFEIGL